MATKFRQLPEVFEDIEMEWSLFRTAMISSAVENCGSKRLRIAASGEKRTPWWNQHNEIAVSAKSKVFTALFKTGHHYGRHQRSGVRGQISEIGYIT